ncbi:MAG TPA: tryptophan-rich sensory protein, partial [Perlabentimonas sp.]|nr:tryptophan-rich sensory protein [Perlabentimonas sp.]
MKLRVANLVSFILMVVVNALANTLPINGQTTGELSAAYPNLFVPAGLTFSIWGVIYLMLLIFVVVQFRESNKLQVQQISWFFVASCLFNFLWIFAWHYNQLPVSLVMMLGLLLALIAITKSMKSQPMSIIKASFGIYLGWVCIATIANVTALLVSYNWGGWGLTQQAWAMIMISVGALISIVTIIRFNNPMVGLAVVWAFIGIQIKQHGDYPAIATAAIVGIVVVGIITILSFL